MTLFLKKQELYSPTGELVGSSYERLCTAPCTSPVAAGTYRFALAQGKSGPVEVSQPLELKGNERLVGVYKPMSRGYSTALISGLLGLGLGAVMVGIATIQETDCEKRAISDDSCALLDRGSQPLLGLGLTVSVVSAVALAIGLSGQDKATISVVPGVSALRGHGELAAGSGVFTSGSSMQGLSLRASF